MNLQISNDWVSNTQMSVRFVLAYGLRGAQLDCRCSAPWGVFRNQSLAKQFQDGTKQASQLSYDVDYSTLGTQSCNGRIPAKGSKTIYLGFENERVRYANYLWVEAEVVVPNTVYYTTKYTVKWW